MLAWQVPKVRSRWRVALIILAGCGIAACAPEPPRSAAQKEADDATTQRVEVALKADTTSDFSKVTVSTYDGVVHLGGLAWSTDAMYTAARVAGSVTGVKKVSNEIQLVSSQTPR